ncbi:MAG TPA: hypothetical protein VLM79_00550 [Kofleriaceae bacterium]|nr:hypothetical protein [Kofleriaceae bacterium]
MRPLVALLACATACQGQGTGVGSGAPNGSASGSAIGVPIGAAEAPDDAAALAALDDALADLDLDARARTAELDEPPAPADPARVIAELGAIPAWQSVVDRAQLLGRRRQHGVVYGRVGPAIFEPAPLLAAPSDAGAPPDAGLVPSPYVWLIDDTDGNGTLGIRIALGDKAKEGDRIAAGGAWQLDAERRWFWKPDAIQPLPPAPSSDVKDPQPPAPGHAIASGALPSGARTISVARDGDAVYFQIVGPAPLSEGDGWPIADQLGSPVVALMNLPGERASYGGQDMRATDERWQLKRGQTYWVRIGKLRKRGPDKPALVNARTAPVRVL